MAALACTFMVACQKAPVAVTGVTVSPATLVLNEKETSTVTATVMPADAADQTISWTSDNTSVASVNASGVVTAISAGTANIKVTTIDGGFTATCAVTVHALVAGVVLDKKAVTLNENEKVTLTPTISPANASNTNVTWSSSDTNVATVSNGEVTAVKAGKATITVTTEDGGMTATCEITVLAPVSGVTLDKTSVSLNEGQTADLVATVAPDNASNKKVTWSTSDASVATVKDGKVTAVNVGTATITVTTEDGNKTATCTVTVLAVVTGVTLDRSAVTVMVGQKANLTATILPAKASNKNVSWKSSDASVATVENGVVTAVKAGTATITVTTEDGNKTATCTITVTDANGFGAEDYNNGKWNW